MHSGQNGNAKVISVFHNIIVIPICTVHVDGNHLQCYQYLISLLFSSNPPVYVLPLIVLNIVL